MPAEKIIPARTHQSLLISLLSFFPQAFFWQPVV
jgi:hypothetical protein